MAWVWPKHIQAASPGLHLLYPTAPQTANAFAALNGREANGGKPMVYQSPYPIQNSTPEERDKQAQTCLSAG